MSEASDYGAQRRAAWIAHMQESAGLVNPPPKRRAFRRWLSWASRARTYMRHLFG